MPKTTIKNNLSKKQFDVALDLTTEINRFAVYLLQMSQAPVQVAFDSKEKSPYTNLAIRVAEKAALADKYHAMLKYINAIANSKTRSHLELK